MHSHFKWFSCQTCFNEVHILTGNFACYINTLGKITATRQLKNHLAPSLYYDLHPYDVTSWAPYRVQYFLLTQDDKVLTVEISVKW